MLLVDLSLEGRINEKRLHRLDPVGLRSSASRGDVDGISRVTGIARASPGAGAGWARSIGSSPGTGRATGARLGNIAREALNRAGDEESLEPSLLLALAAEPKAGVGGLAETSGLLSHGCGGGRTGHVREDAAAGVDDCGARGTEVLCGARQGGGVDALAPRGEGALLLDGGAEGEPEEDVDAADSEQEERRDERKGRDVVRKDCGADAAEGRGE